MIIEDNELVKVREVDIPRDGHFIVPDNITTIRAYCFSSLKSLKQITLPESLTLIENASFSGCKNLKSVKIPKNVKFIYIDTFNECASLKEVILPEGLEKIGACAFFNCTSLKSINIPPTTDVRTTFCRCYSLKSVNGLKTYYVDRIPMIIISKHKVEDYDIFKGYFITDINKKNKQYSFIASKDGFNAHGETIQEAIYDVNYKITHEKLAKEPIYMNTIMSIDRYRALTGSCSLGIKIWMEENEIKKDDKLTVRELLPILEKTGAYGLEQFKACIKDL